jgi:hypothetical protein
MSYRIRTHRLRKLINKIQTNRCGGSFFYLFCRIRTQTPDACMTYSWENLTVYRTGIVSKIKFWIKKVKFLRFNEGPFKVQEIPSALQQELPDLENVEIFIIFLVSEPFWPSWIQILNRTRIHCTVISYNRMWSEEYKHRLDAV